MFLKVFKLNVVVPGTQSINYIDLKLRVYTRIFGIFHCANISPFLYVIAQHIKRAICNHLAPYVINCGSTNYKMYEMDHIGIICAIFWFGWDVCVCACVCVCERERTNFKLVLSYSLKSRLIMDYFCCMVGKCVCDWWGISN